jgi:hypothetical protein
MEKLTNKKNGKLTNKEKEEAYPQGKGGSLPTRERGKA